MGREELETAKYKQLPKEFYWKREQINGSLFSGELGIKVLGFFFFKMREIIACLYADGMIQEREKKWMMWKKIFWGIPLSSEQSMWPGTPEEEEALDNNMDISSVVVSKKARNMVVDTGRRVDIVLVGSVEILLWLLQFSQWWRSKVISCHEDGEWSSGNLRSEKKYEIFIYESGTVK